MQSFFQPQSVVLIGVTRQSGPGAYNNFEMMLRYGYPGRAYLVHPKVPDILGHRTYPSVADLPEVPELAVISLGRDRVLPVFEECARKGIRRVIIISQGFADADAHGEELQNRLKAAAKEYGVRIVGPNTMGVVNAFSGFSTAFIDLERPSSPPPLTLLVQSGVFQVGYECFTGVFGKSIDIGNTSDVDFVEVLQYLETDPQTRVIALHMEGMKRGREFLRTAARVARTKPIVVLKTGRSAAGAEAALSHTGSLVGEDAIFEAAFARAGLVRVHNMVEMLAVCQSLLRFRSMAGPRLAVVTATGACGIMTADACEDYGLELAPFPEEIREELENPHIAWHKLRNPVDLWPLGMVSGSFANVFKRAVKGLLEAERVDAVLCIAPALGSPLHEDVDLVGAVLELNRDNVHRKPIAMWLYGGDQLRQAPGLGDEPGVAAFRTIDEAVMGLAGVWRYEVLKREAPDPEARFGPVVPSRKAHAGLQPGSLLVGDAAFKVLEPFGIPLVPGSLAGSEEQAILAAREMGYPVVLKIISPDWLHKSDLGGIRLDVTSETGLTTAFRELQGLFTQKTPGGKLEGILVQKQISGTELLMGIKKDPQFGPILVVGTGGVYTEVFRDVARSLAPLDRDDARRMLRSLRLYPILEGIRGQKGVNLDAVLDTLVALSRLAVDFPEISELDLNPVLANPEGCWCVDCRIVT